MKKFFLIAIFGLLTLSTYSQILKPVQWTSTIEEAGTNEFILTFKATIDPEWHIYSQFTPEGGALPAEFGFENQEGNYELMGATEESVFKKVFNDIFEVDEYYFDKEATFTQRIKVINDEFATF
ncbi:MAG: thiol:disulfide interchange protein, partial [Flavobacterium sp.]